MNFLHEIFYTLFPLTLKLVAIPLTGIIWLFELDIWNQLSLFVDNQNAYYTFHILLRAFFFGAGTMYVVTLIKVVLKLLQTIFVSGNKKTKSKKHLTPAVQRWILLISILIALIGEFLLLWFQDDVILPDMFGWFVIVPYLITLSLGVFALLFFALRFIFQKLFTLHSPFIEKTKVAILLVVGISPLVIVGVVFIAIFFDPLGNPQASRFFTLHAAIKNTCFMHPERLHCPKTLEEIGYIEPKHYESMMNSSQAIYRYYPEVNSYTFIIRYSPVRAVIFDQRLVQSQGIDFKEYDVNVLGTDRVLNPPDFLGEITFEEWEY